MHDKARAEWGRTCAWMHRPIRRGQIVVWDSTKRFRQAFYFLLSENTGMIPYPANGRKRAELALRLKDAVAAEPKKRQVSQLKKGVEKPVPQKSAQRERRETRDELAKMAGVSHDTIAKVEKIVAEAEPEVVEAARRGSWRPCATLMQTKGE